jgi:hypothetical protein
MFKFTFVRNPFDRIHSAYYFLRAGGMGGLDEEFGQQVLGEFPTFEHFVFEGLEKEEIAGFWHFLPDTHFLSFEAGRAIELDFIGRYENLARDFDVVRRRVNPSARLAHSNLTPQKEDYRRAYTAKMVDSVARQYGADLELFGYEFEGAVRPIQLTSATGSPSTTRP